MPKPHYASCTKPGCLRSLAELRGHLPARWAENHRHQIPDSEHLAPRELEARVELMLRKRKQP